jgi:hypothetical protein
MSSVLEYIDRNPQEAQRLVGLKYEQLKNLIVEKGVNKVTIN